jgi:uncharacterized membrane protein YdjX (TVP38/TMEM64 family)
VTRKSVYRALALLAIGGGIGGFVWLHFASGVTWRPDSLRDAVADLGVFGPLAMIGIMTFRPFLALPSWLVMVAAGMLFGSVLGTFCGALGGLLGALLIFGIARALGREAVQSWLRIGTLRAFEEFLALRGAPWLALYTAIPVTWLTPVFAGAGVSRMRFATFCTAVGIGLIPRAGLFAVAGRAAAQPTVRNISFAIALALAAVVATFFARRWLSERPSD